MVWSTSPNARSHFADVDLTTDAPCHWRSAVALKARPQRKRILVIGFEQMAWRSGMVCPHRFTAPPL